MWLSILIFGLFLVAIFYSFRFKNIETPKYKILRKISDVEIREYPAMTLAQTKLKSNRYDGNEDNGFRTVAGYIFGGNSKQQKIAMTAPVIMQLSDSGSSISFVMPSQYRKDELPEPNSDQVKIVSQSPVLLAVLQFKGFASEQKIIQYRDQLLGILKTNNIKVKSDLFYMGYNAPWDVVNRRNEVAFQIEKDSI